MFFVIDIYTYMYVYNDSIEISRFRPKLYELSDSILYIG